MAANKTLPTRASVKAHLDALPSDALRRDARRIRAILEEESGEKPVMWGPSIVGFGTCHYKYESGREGDMPRIGFAARKSGLVLYLQAGFEGHADLLAKLGNPKHGASCLYLKRLEGLDEGPLRALVRDSLARTDALYSRAE